jgi:hypothetical protein
LLVCIGYWRHQRPRGGSLVFAELVFLWFPIIPLGVVIALRTVGGVSDASQMLGTG